MQDDNSVKRNFLNRRNWTSYASALPGETTYPKITEAVKYGRAWFTENASHASNWLVAGADLLAGDVRRA